MAGESAVQIMAPLLSLVAAVGALLAYGLRRGLEPLDHAARDVAARSATSLQPIPTDDVPEELSPLVVAISGLMARLDEAFTAQRRFLADAAHELRTPLTALRLQQQLLARAPDEASRREALVALEQGIERSQRLIEQLLQVSRAEPDGEPLHLEPVDLDALTMEVVSSLSPKADRLGIDLGAGLPTGARVAADRNHVEVLLTNLVDNALRYTPKGGVVDVCTAIDGDAVELVVTDTGPGIPEAERERVFDRFYRGEKATVLARDTGGSGLGLAIVKAIALRHGATALLSTPPAGRGLEVRVRFRPSDDRSATSAVAA